MKKVKFLLVSLIILSFSSCGKVESTVEPTIEPTVEPTIEPTIEPTPEKNMLEAHPRNIDIENVRDLPFDFVNFRSKIILNEEDGIYYYQGLDDNRNFQSMFFGGRVSFKWVIEKYENGYYSYVGSKDYEKYGLYNNVYIYISCNQNIELFENKKSLIGADNNKYDIYYNTYSDDYGCHLQYQYPFEIDGNQYILGVHYINANVDLSDEGIKYVNENSNYEIKLGQEVFEIENFDELSKDEEYNNSGLCFGFWATNKNVKYNAGFYLLGDFVEQNGYSMQKTSDNLYVTSIVIRNDEEISVCGINITMSLKEAETSLINQGFTKLSDRSYSLGRVNLYLGKYNGQQDIEYISLELTQSVYRYLEY